MWYRCDHCGSYFDEDDRGTTTICLEDEYGVGGMFDRNTMEEVGCCPDCGCTDLEEVSMYDLVCEIERLKRIIKKLKEK